MDVDMFWTLIETAKAQSGGEIEKQYELLIEAVSKLSEEDIVEFDAVFTQMSNKAYRADLMDASDIICGGLGDDGFSDFRAWLVAQGKSVYESIIGDVEKLADVVELGQEEDLEFESFGYVGLLAYERKTSSYDDMPAKRESRPKLVGEMTDDEMELKAKYPRLTAKFWQDIDKEDDGDDDE